MNLYFFYFLTYTQLGTILIVGHNFLKEKESLSVSIVPSFSIDYFDTRRT